GGTSSAAVLCDGGFLGMITASASVPVAWLRSSSSRALRRDFPPRRSEHRRPLFRRLHDGFRRHPDLIQLRCAMAESLLCLDRCDGGECALDAYDERLEKLSHEFIQRLDRKST